MTECRRLIVCADDFPLDAGVRDAVFELVEQRRISAVSCLTDTKLWPSAGEMLSKLPGNIAIGLHFNLTELPNNEGNSIYGWILRALAGAIDQQVVRDELQRQWDAFCVATGRPPDFIDGHQHVHALPGIAEVVARFACRAGTSQSIPIRAVTHFFGRTDAPWKRRIISGLARLGSRNLTGSQPLNTAFSGDYSLSATADYPALFENWLSNAPDRGLIMCHPSCQSMRGQAHAAARKQEYDLLRSPKVDELFQVHRLQLVNAAHQITGS
jgi:predicted glycoside hydrolase/deacetylase ChbG (UPF0249 family)